MELYDLDPGVVLLAHEGIGQAFGRKGLASAGRPLQDEVLLAPQQPEHVLQVRRLNVDLAQEVVPRVRLGCVLTGFCFRSWGNRRRLLILVFEDRFELLRVVSGVLRYSLQGHLADTPVERPRTDVRPLDVPHGAVGGAAVVVAVLGADNSAADELSQSASRVDDVTGAYGVNEVPVHSRRPCRVTSLIPVSGFQRVNDLLDARKSSEITDLGPVDGHDPGGLELLPFRGTLTGRVEPVPPVRFTHRASREPHPATPRALR